MRRKSCKTIGALLVATMVLSSTTLAVFPTEEEFSAPPIVKEFESEGYSKVTVTRGNLQKVEDINAKYKGTVREELMPDGSGIIEKVCVKKEEQNDNDNNNDIYNLNKLKNKYELNKNESYSYKKNKSQIIEENKDNILLFDNILSIKKGKKIKFLWHW